MKAFTDDLMTRFEKKMEESLLKFDNQLKERLSTVENIVIRLDKQYSEIREEVKAVTFKADKNAETISHFENEISQRDKKIEQLALEIDDLRNRGMRKTLIIKGIPEGAEGNDSWDNVKAFIISFLETHAGISGVGVDRAHRAAKKNTPSASSAQAPSIPRAIFVEFKFWEDSSKVLRNAGEICKKGFVYKGKNHRISVEQMVSKRVQAKKQDALKVRKYLLHQNPNWTISVRYLDTIMVRKSQEEPFRKHKSSQDELNSANTYINSLKK